MIPQLAAEATFDQPTGDPAFQRFKFFEAAVAFVRMLGPAMLVLDDLHSADQGSLVLLRHLLGAGLDSVFFVVTVRDADQGTRAAVAAVAEGSGPETEIVHASLEGLPLDAVTELVRLALAGAAVPTVAALADEVWRATDGNPFFARELLRELAEPRDGGANAWVADLRSGAFAIPASVQTRLRRASTACRPRHVTRCPPPR